MLPEYDPNSKILNIDGECFKVESRKRVRGYEFFALEDGRRIISNGDIFLYTPTSSYGARQLSLYENRPPIPKYLLPITSNSLIQNIEEGLAIYKGITGACEGGVEIFLARLKAPIFPIPIKLLVRMTKNKYGSDILEEYINPTGKRLFFGSQNKEGMIDYDPIMNNKELIKAEQEVASKKKEEYHDSHSEQEDIPPQS